MGGGAWSSCGRRWPTCGNTGWWCLVYMWREGRGGDGVDRRGKPTTYHTHRATSATHTHRAHRATSHRATSATTHQTHCATSAATIQPTT